MNMKFEGGEISLGICSGMTECIHLLPLYLTTEMVKIYGEGVEQFECEVQAVPLLDGLASAGRF